MTDIDDDGMEDMPVEIDERSIYCRATTDTGACSTKVQLSQARNACPSCGAEYSKSGQMLAAGGGMS